MRSELTSSDGRIIPLGVFARASLMEHLDAENIFTLTRQGFEFFEEQFGTPYPFEKYDQLFVPEFNAGAMENAGAVTFLESYVFRSRPTDAMVERRAITILHELAHMWFGDLVTMRWWNDLWLNESFAEFMSTLAAAQNTEFTSSWTTFNILEKNWAYRQDQLPSTHPIVAEIHDLEDVQVNFDGITYAKGASVLRQLVAWVGQEEFMAGVRSYFAKHAWKNTELPDLMRELEASSGRDLGAVVEAVAGNRRRQHAARARSPPTMRAPSPPSRSTRPPSPSTRRSARTAWPWASTTWTTPGHWCACTARSSTSPGPPPRSPALVGLKRPALVLVNDDDLAYAKIRLDQHLAGHRHRTPEGLRRLAAAHPGLGRGLGRGARRRDPGPRLRRPGAEQHRARTRFLRDHGAAAPAEHRPGLLRRPRRRRGRAALPRPSRLWDLARAAEAGSDAQLQFAGAFANLAHTAAQLDTVAALLSGERGAGGPGSGRRPALGPAHLTGRRRAAPTPRTSRPSWPATPPPPGSWPRTPPAPPCPPPRPSAPPGMRSSAGSCPTWNSAPPSPVSTACTMPR